MNERRRFMVIAHRGASSYAPENTFAAFDKALDMGVHHAELDVHMTRDGHLVVIHDDTVDRTTNGSGPVSSFTLAELRGLDAGGWFRLQYAGERVPSLGQVFENYKGRIYFHVEIKGRTPGLARRTCDMVRAYGMADSVTMTSFWKPWLEEVREYAPELATGWLVPMGPGTPWDDGLIEEALELGLTQLCPRGDLVTPDLVERLHARGLVVRAWGIPDEAVMRQVVDAGADGMTINFPDRLVEYLRDRGIPQAGL